MEVRNKNALIGGLLAIVFVMAVGYAAFATQLNINGTASVTSTWDVEITSITAGTPVGSASSNSASVGADGLSATFSADLQSPGDSITYTVTVANQGTLDAKLTNIKFTSGDTDAITVEYAGIAVNDTLTAKQSTTFTVTVTYNSSVTSQPADEALTASTTLVLTYEQA